MASSSAPAFLPIIDELVKAASHSYDDACVVLRDIRDNPQQVERIVEELKTITNDGGARRQLQQLKRQLSPALRHNRIQELLNCTDESSINIPRDPLVARAELARVIESIQKEIDLHNQVFGFLERTMAPIFDAGGGAGIGRSNRARRVSNLFNVCAGNSQAGEEGEKLDRHGNAADAKYDLGVDGAFDGHAIHIIQEYNFSFRHAETALKKKGFTIKHHGLSRFTSTAELREFLSDATQLWVIASAREILTEEQIDVIIEFHRNGHSLYIWGDNEPFFVDANRILQRLFPNLKMSGNLRGKCVVGLRNPEKGRDGFVNHFVTTGVRSVYEGDTVAILPESSVKEYGFEPILYGTGEGKTYSYRNCGNLITAIREPVYDEISETLGGAIAIDTAFTRLYCEWDNAGTARFVTNLACWLAAARLMVVPNGAEVEAEGMTTLVDEFLAEINGINCNNASSSSSSSSSTEKKKACPVIGLAGECDLTCAPTELLTLVFREMPDPLINTANFAVDFPLAMGRNNRHVLSQQVYDLQIGEMLLERGEDPYTRRPVVGLLPLLNLSEMHLRHRFDVQLCKWLLGGTNLPSTAEMILFAIVQEMRIPGQETEHPEAWDFLYRQLLDNLRGRFQQEIPPAPIAMAMKTLFSCAMDIEAIRQPLEANLIIARTLHEEQLLPIADIRLVLLRSWIKTIVALTLQFLKTKTSETGVSAATCLWDSLRPALFSTVADGLVVVDGSGHQLTALPSFIPDYILPYLRQSLDGKHAELQFNVDPLAIATLVLFNLLQLSSSTNLCHFTTEKLLRRITTFSELGCEDLARLWLTQKPPFHSMCEIINSRFNIYRKAKQLAMLTGHQVPIAVPFVTPLGPSVFTCGYCGLMFGNPSAEVTVETAKTLRTTRGQHFANVFAAAEESGYVLQGSLHIPLHRAVQITCTKPEFIDIGNTTNPMIQDVIHYIVERNIGYFHMVELEDIVRSVMDSYWACISAGDEHVQLNQGPPTLEKKMHAEKKKMMIKEE